MGIFDKIKDALDGDNDATETTRTATQAEVEQAASDYAAKPNTSATRAATAEELAQASSDYASTEVDGVTESAAQTEAKEAAAAAAAKAAADAKAAKAAAEAKAAKAAAEAKAAKAAAAKKAAEKVTYTVKSGDTLSAIGERFGVDWREIAKVNKVKNPDLIFPGQVFTIPKK